MLAVRTPGAPLATRTLSRPAIPPSPLRDRVGYSDHDRFRGYFPVHFIPAYNLPVYASQWPSRDTTQDSLRGCSLGFTAAAISGGRVQRTCTAQRSQNRSSASFAAGRECQISWEFLIRRSTLHDQTSNYFVQIDTAKCCVHNLSPTLRIQVYIN